ncbi:hypothetical protein [Luteimonas fraxinea]|uniref:Uncharacterized protein n=1 Tax=Luteimonas fraxinea TaxID=2901869 RepID=A0ABS8U9N0_9GAMM|nr:hypothetical protein [Luteimonas fraxinea]MCD9096178.1 hypothetical protein [Luteimonas fraxinea]
MTAQQKVGAGAGAILLAILTLVLSSQSLPFMQWMWAEVKLIWALPLFAPTVFAILVGAGAPAWLPHALPPCWPAHRTMRVTRLLGFAIAFLMVVSRYRSAVGIQYGLFAGTGAYVVWTIGSGLFYRMRPHAQPESLKGDNSDA